MASSNGTKFSSKQGNVSSRPPLRKPTFIKVDELKPGTSGHNLTVKILSSKKKKGRPVYQNPRQTRIAECIIGDETGTIIFTAHNDQIALMKPGSTINIRNAKINMFKGTMRLVVDRWGLIEVTEPATFTVKEDNNLSLVEYELVNVQDEGQ